MTFKGYLGSFRRNPNQHLPNLFLRFSHLVLLSCSEELKIVSSKISIRLSSPADHNPVLMEIGLPVDGNELMELKYSHEKITEDLSIKKWLMPGLCIIHEDVCEGLLPELTISGNHVSLICYGSAAVQDIPKTTFHLSGTMEIRNTKLTSVPGGDARKKCVLIIFSKPLLSKLLQSESWIRGHSLSDLLGPVSGSCHSYFLELPVRQILNAILNEHLEPSQKRYYFELKLKELFFILHLQPGGAGFESTIPADIQQKLIAAKAYLLANYTTAPTIKQLSRIVSLNEFWLKQFFKIRFGTTIRSYLTTLRMEEATNLLTANRSVNEVAAQLGYKNVSHFILTFKKTFGVTPRQMMYK